MALNHKGSGALMERLRKEVGQVKAEHYPIKVDNAFVLWFAEAYLVGDRRKAFDGVVGGPGDKTVDAVYVDERNRIVQLVQGKYHYADARDDSALCDFAARARDFWSADFAEELKHAGPGARRHLQEAHRILHGHNKGDFQLRLYFVTTGRIAPKCQTRAKQIAAVSGNTRLEVLDRSAVLGIFSDWLEGSSPPLSELEILVDGPQTLVHQGGHLQGWIFTTNSQEVSRLYKTAGERLFARNVRGYLGGDTSINRR